MLRAYTVAGLATLGLILAAWMIFKDPSQAPSIKAPNEIQDNLEVMEGIALAREFEQKKAEWVSTHCNKASIRRLARCKDAGAFQTFSITSRGEFFCVADSGEMVRFMDPVAGCPWAKDETTVTWSDENDSEEGD